ncbi:MAG: hypothetical protein B6D64_10505 [Bacteroidetes bacterium 4484_276]|nr:MAG: hypothetical protein B6D64_10505 [Bacteroidetes bacterium 4484_276]
MKKTSILIITSLLFCAITLAQTSDKKRPIDQKDYPGWKVIGSTQISNDGQWISYEVNPQKGDGMLFVYDIESQRYDSIPRGYKAKFSGGSKFLVCKIKPEEDTVIKAKLAKKKKDELPKDSLGVYVMEKNHLTKIARVKSFKLGQEGKDWLAWLMEKPLPEKDTTDKSDTTIVKEKKPKKKKKGDGTELVIKKVIEDKSWSFKDVTGYNVSKNGELFSFIRQMKDSIDSTFVYNFSTKKQIDELIFEQEGVAKKPGIDDEGTVNDCFSARPRQLKQNQKTHCPMTKKYMWTSGTGKTPYFSHSKRNSLKKKKSETIWQYIILLTTDWFNLPIRIYPM